MIRVKGTWEGIVGYWINGNERFVSTMHGWGQLKEVGRTAYVNCEYQLRGCQGNGCEWHHRFGRGGGKRDDRIYLPDGARGMYWTCRTCHEQVRIERKSCVSGEGLIVTSLEL